MKEKTNKESTHQKGGMTYRSSSRRNGWTCPPHPLQFVAWIFIAFFAVMFHGMAVPAIPYHWQPACHMIVGITLAVHVVTHLVCLSIDPADPSTFRRQKKVMPTFDRMQHNHVIENNHCYLCEVDVGVKSKHCSSCNKCVADFDHHCKWLNNCVGSRNYRWFITCLSSSFLSCLFVFIVFLYLSVVYWVNPRLLHPDLFDGATTTQANFLTSQPPTGQLSSNSTSQYNSDTTPDPLEVYRGGLDIFRPVPGIAFFVVSIVIAVLLLLTLCLLGHLLGFHLYLMCKGMTTYDYVVQDRSAITGRDVEAQQQQARQKGCCKCNNQVVPLPKEKEDMELTETKKDTTSQLESNNNSNGNLQQQLVVAEPLIKQEQQQEQQQQQVEMGAAVIDSKPKVKRKKKAKRKPPRMRPLTTRDKLQPALMEHPYPALMNPAHSMPQTYLEQHLVRRFSLPLVAAHGMHPKYPQGEPVEDLFFTQQFPTMQQPVVTPQGGLNPRRQLPLPAAISFDSPTPALDYHSSSAESLTEVPLGPSRRSNPAQRGMLPSSGHQVVSGYQQPLDKWQPNHNSHPNLMMNDNQWQPDAEQWPIERLVDVNVKSGPRVQKAKRKGHVKPEDVSTGAKVLDRTERQRRDSKLEPLLIKTAHLPEGHEPPSATVCQTDRNTGKNSKRKPKKQVSPVETTADVHQELDHHERLPQNSSNENTQDTSKPEAQEVPDSYTKPELGSHGQQEAPPVPPVAPPRRRALKLGLEPSSHSGSQSSLQSSSSHQHLLEAEDRSSKPPRKTRKGDLKDANQHDAVSLPGSIPEVPPLDLTPLVDTRNSDMGSVADREPSGGEGSLSDDELVEGCSSPAKSLDPLRPMASRRSLLLRY